MPIAGSLADALLVPAYLKQGVEQIDRVRSVNRICEPLLGVDPGKGEMCFIRVQGPDWMFVTKDPRDSMNYPKRHPRRCQPRYDWVDDHATGIRRGYLRGD